MPKRIHPLYLLVIGMLSLSANAAYFPDGIDWTNPSSTRFVQSLHLNMLGRAPQNREVTAATTQLQSADSREQRLRLFLQIEGSGEYQRLFNDSDRSWRIFQAPDYNYNAGDGFWRYQAARFKPDGFQLLRSGGAYSQQIAKAIAGYYNDFCYQQPCVNDPQVANVRGAPAADRNVNLAHACADTANHTSQFEWAGSNGTTYPVGINDRTLCMGQHYYEAVDLVLQRHQCDSGYQNCRRDAGRDLRGQRSGRDSAGNPAIYFRDGSRLSLLTSSDTSDAQRHSAPTAQPTPTGQVHACGDPQQATSRYQWRGPQGNTIASGVDSSVVCMNNFYFVIDGLTLLRYQCSSGFANCQRQPSQDLTAKRRVRIDGAPGMEFSDGTTLALVQQGQSNGLKPSTGNTTDDPFAQPQRQPTVQSRRRGEHDCADPTRRISQFRWTRKNGATTWPDGIDGSIVCQSNSYYVIEGVTLRHHRCDDSFMNCRANPRNDLIALQDGNDRNGYRTLVFANGDTLSLISR